MPTTPAGSEPLPPQHAPHELAERLIFYTEPDLVYSDEIERPVVEIVDDVTIAINGVQQRLSSTKVFVFNALRLSQGYGVTAPEIMDMGFSGSRTGLNGAVAMLAQRCNELAGQPIIETTRPSVRAMPSEHTLLPEVEIKDTRGIDPETRKAQFLRNCVFRAENGDAKILPTGSIAFVNGPQREEATRMLLHEYRDRSLADTNFAKLFKHVNARAVSRPLQSLSFLEPLSKEEEAALLFRKEYALLQYINDTDSRDSAGIDGVRAMYELFAHNLDIVAGSARFYASRYLPYSELYQEGAAQLMEAVIKQTYFQDASQNFRFIARACVLEHKKRGLGPLMARYSVPLRPPDDYNEYRDTVRAAIEQFRAEHHKAPALDEISAATTMRKDTILGVLAIAEGPVYLDEQPMLSEEIDSKADLLLIDDDFVTGRLDQMEITEAMDTLFRSADLGNVEKLILSLQFGIFHASLSGTTVERSGQELFTYPHSEEDFTALMNTKETGRYARTARLLHRSEKNIAKDLRVALHSAQNALKAFDSLVDKYSNAGQVAEVLDATEQRKTDMVSLALQVSPDAPLTTRQLRALVREGNFPYNEGDVKQTFKTMNAFHVACGFEVDKSQRFKGISVDKILDLAIDLNPKDALNTNEIEILAKHGEFVSTMVIYQRFKSIPAFRDAVRQRIAARQGQ